ncbi:Rne/Rng family ribonuclease [Shimia ponticola]|uniref:Rne/Rng family ribonuclease n=1 Tax=Shimia ponticola TaxID=2582893 RepID=UPI0011BE8ACF|nr:ribonuclease E/G [Shimia ponticola]
MPKKMLIDATHAEETRVVVVDGNKVEEFDFESQNKRQLAGNIYLAKVTRVEPSLQAAFVDYGGNRHGFLAFSEIHPDYYQIPVADREALLAEEKAYADAQRAQEEQKEEGKKSSRSRSRSKSKSSAAAAKSDDPKVTQEVADSDTISGMETIDVPAEDEAEPIGLVDADGAPDAVEAEAEKADEAAEPKVAEEAADQPAEAAQDASDAAPEAEETISDAEEAETAEAATNDADDEDEKPYSASDDAAERDASIESVAQEDDQDEVRPVRKPRPRRYKIQEVIKVRQILLVQVVKEERGNKGAALTTYLSLAGRYCVLMPNTARGGGISRKITNASDRKKLKEIAGSMEVPDGAGLIVRTAGAKRTKTEIKRDYEYLQRLWEQIRELTLKSSAPAKIYEEGDLIKRSIRDLYNKDIDEVLVEGADGYRVAKDFMKMIMPSHSKNVKHYTDGLPLFARYQVEGYLDGMFNPTVQLKSGGYIVIGITEALVAIDVNSGRATKEGSIEETATKTNLEAAEEVARQLRLRDLAGLIVIDFIDMEDRRNNAKVEKMLKDKLKTDRARIQVGRISGFGLLEMSRQRLRPGMIEATTQPCPSCHGTGIVRSDDSLGLSILRVLDEEGTRRRSKEVLVKAPVQIANFLINQKREHLAQIEARHGLSVRIEADPQLISPDYAIEKFKTATRVLPDVPVVTGDASLMADYDEEEAATEAQASDEAETPEAEDAPAPKKRRRRRRRRKSTGNGENADAQEASQSTDGESADDAAADAKDASEATEADAEEKPKPKSRSRSRSRSRGSKSKAAVAEAEAKDAAAEETPEPESAPEVAADEPVAKAVEPAQDKAEEVPADAAPETKSDVVAEVKEESSAKEPAAAEPVPALEPESELAVAEAEAPEPEAPKVEEPPKPKRKGWWSLRS